MFLPQVKLNNKNDKMPNKKKVLLISAEGGV